MDSSNWQTQLSTVRERNKYAFNKSLFCDVEFSVQDSNGVNSIPANKYVLAISSPVFEAMFYGQLAESKPTIDLTDCTKEGLHELLRYVYSDEVNLTGSNCLEVLYLAEKYMMPFLVEKCKKYLQEIVVPENVLSVLPQVEKIGDEELQKHLWDIVDTETHRTVSSEPFLDISREMLCEILARDSLDIKELDLFRAVDRWAEKRIEEQSLESNGETKRSILGEEVIRLIRFPVMEQKEFAELVIPCEMLKKNELMELFKAFNKVSSAKSMFIEEERLPVPGSILIPSMRFCNIVADLMQNPKNAAINFTVNKAVYIVGVRMFGYQGTKYDVELKIYKDNETIAQLSSRSFLTESEKIDDRYYGYTINLDKPVRLEPSVVYTVEATISGGRKEPGYEGRWALCGERGKATITAEDITITYINLPKSDSTTIHEGQFPTLIFRRCGKRSPQRK